MVIARAKLSPAGQQSRRALGLFAGVRSGTLTRYVFAVVVTLAVSGYVAAQVGINEVHVLPRFWFGKAHGGRALPVLQWTWDGPDRRAQVEAPLPTQVLQVFLFTATRIY
jgi:hypothetical protein